MSDVTPPPDPMTPPAGPSYGATPPPASAPPAGWYPDPATPGSQRYWDGQAWTDHQAPGYTQSPAYAAPAPAYAQATGSYGYAAQGPVIRKFGFGESIRRGLHGWKDFSSRATVGEYWWFYLFAALVTLPFYIGALVSGIVLVSTSTTITYADDTSGGYDPSGTTVWHTNTGALAVFIILGVLYLAVALFLLLPILAVGVRRLHDTSRSGWWYLIAFVPFGSLVLLVFFIMSSTPTTNEYGPPVT